MKAIYRLYLLMFLFVAYACTDENIPSGSQVKEGEPVVLNLNLSLSETKDLSVESRAELSTTVSDFYLFIFSANGALKDKYFFPQGADNSDAEYSSNNGATINRTSVSEATISNIKTTSGNSYILGVANVNMKTGNEILGTLNGITTMDGLKSALAVEPTIDPTVFTMSGYYSPDENLSTNNGAVAITPNENLTGYIHLIPVDAHITFEVQANTETGRNFTFTLDSWQVINVPKKVSLYSTGADTGDEFYNSASSTQIVKTAPTDGGKDIYSFDFFVQERLQTADKEIGDYGDRAAWDTTKSNDPTQKTFTNAPENATYVILKGRYKGGSSIQQSNQTAGSTSIEEVDAEVVYTIFLGEDSDTNFKDFTTNRNMNYTYTITVSGVKDISVEVRADKENRADAEGEIILSEGEVLEFDAHYSATVLEFNVGQVRTAINEGRMGYSVVTPYGNQVYVEGEDETTAMASYAAWVSFYYGTNQVGSNHYPKTYDKDEVIPNKMTVKGLLEDLKTKVEDTQLADDEVLLYTAYIDEFYYDKRPDTNVDASWKEFVNVDNRKLLILSDTEVSNDKNSSITTAAYVLSQKSIKTIYNKDASGLQRAWGLESIEEPLAVNGTITLDEAQNTAVNPNYRYPYVNQNDNADDNESAKEKYGRKMALSVNTNAVTWNNLIANTGYLTNLSDAYAACMKRNRDLDGDGNIDPDEVRWYLPTIFQYQQMYIGMYGITDPNARLYYNEVYDPNPYNRWVPKHYISSNDQWIFWSEEGISSGNYNEQKGWYNGWHTPLHVRCVRDLGTALTKDDNAASFNNTEYQFQDFFTTTATGTGNVIELTYLNEASVRTALESKEVSAPVTTFSLNNRPVIRFEYSDYLKENGNDLQRTFASQNDAVDNGENSICNNLNVNGATGWRLPTITELNIMLQGGVTLKTDGSRTISRTKYEFYIWNGETDRDQVQPDVQTYIPANAREFYNENGYYGYFGRYGHTYGGGGRNFHLPNGGLNDRIGNFNCYIRCVRDVAK